jgi:ribosomal protein S12 methylthiotransferase accessory factor YcaO
MWRQGFYDLTLDSSQVNCARLPQIVPATTVQALLTRAKRVLLPVQSDPLCLRGHMHTTTGHVASLGRGPDPTAALIAAFRRAILFRATLGRTATFIAFAQAALRRATTHIRLFRQRPCVEWLLSLFTSALVNGSSH